MSRTERIYRIDQILNEHKVVSFKTLQEALEVSPATLKRDLEYLRDRLNSPIVWDREAGGYRFDKQPTGAQYELPGLWFSAEEIHALLTMQHLLSNLDGGGILTPHIQPLMTRLNALMGSADDEASEVRRRVMVFSTAKREVKLAHFERVGAALLHRKRLFITYAGRGRGETTEREISPQRLASASRLSVSSTTARTGTSTPGATCVTAYATFRWTPSRGSMFSTRKPGRSPSI